MQRKISTQEFMKSLQSTDKSSASEVELNPNGHDAPNSDETVLGRANSLADMYKGAGKNASPEEKQDRFISSENESGELRKRLNAGKIAASAVSAAVNVSRGNKEMTSNELMSLSLEILESASELAPKIYTSINGSDQDEAHRQLQESPYLRAMLTEFSTSVIEKWYEKGGTQKDIHLYHRVLDEALRSNTIDNSLFKNSWMPNANSFEQVKLAQAEMSTEIFLAIEPFKAWLKRQVPPVFEAFEREHKEFIDKTSTAVLKKADEYIGKLDIKEMEQANKVPAIVSALNQSKKIYVSCLKSEIDGFLSDGKRYEQEGRLNEYVEAYSKEGAMTEQLNKSLDSFNQTLDSVANNVNRDFDAVFGSYLEISDGLTPQSGR
jgi:hypothetical protein